jgi:hypothetical protein
MRRCKHAGSSLDEFLAEDGTSAEVEAAAEDARSGRSLPGEIFGSLRQRSSRR